MKVNHLPKTNEIKSFIVGGTIVKVDFQHILNTFVKILFGLNKETYLLGALFFKKSNDLSYDHSTVLNQVRMYVEASRYL